MNDITRSLLEDLQSDLNKIKSLESNIEVAWQLEKLKEVIKTTKDLILKSIES